ncbi:MAG TPA: hypothetical protein VJ142_02120 [Candidatus Nanoarchaeia archaeon]|nr:hypothetical protein [Candidatus Nanoarchaeia archaeon]
MGLEKKTSIKRILEITLLVKLGLAGIALSMAAPYDKPKWYETEWKRMQKCTQIKASEPYYLKLNWPLNNGLPCFGMSKRFQRWGCGGTYVPGFHTILIPENNINNKDLVRHEQVHALGLEHGAFLERCGVYFND